jgi:hypothetical protein
MSYVDVFLQEFDTYLKNIMFSFVLTYRKNNKIKGNIVFLYPEFSDIDIPFETLVSEDLIYTIGSESYISGLISKHIVVMSEVIYSYFFHLKIVKIKKNISDG